MHDWSANNSAQKEASGTDLVLDRGGNVYATGYIQLDNVDYATIRIPWDWDEDPDNLEKGTWDHSETDDRASSIDLSYEVEGGVIKPYIYVTGKSSSTYYNIVTIRYSHHTSGNTLTNVWTDVYLSTNSVDDIGNMIVGAGYGNCYVIGRSNNNYIMLGLRRNGTHRITPVTYSGPGAAIDEGLAIGMAGAGQVHMTGESTGDGTALDYATLADFQDVFESSPHYEDVQVGTEVSGDLEDIEASDNAYKVYQRYHEDIATEVLVIEYEGTSAISFANHPSELTIRIEGKCSVAPVTMKVELWNAVTSQYDDFGTLPVTTTDSERVIVVKDDPLAYITSYSSMALRLSFLETVGQSTLWTYSVDRIVWEVIED